MNVVTEVILELITFGAATAASMAGARGVETMLKVRRRLAGETPVRSSTASPLLQNRTVRNPFLIWVQSSTSISDDASRARLQRDLAAAGFEHVSAPIWYVIIRFSLAIMLPVIFVAFQAMASKPVTGFPLTVWSLCLCGLGLLAPRIFITNRGRARTQQFEQEFPDALDLLLVCVEAGLGLEAAFVRVARETTQSHPRTSAELHKVVQELNAGRSRPDALRAMADRATVDSVKSFVALVIQTDALGTSIAQTLKTFANEMRQTRFLKAEEKALRIPVLLSVPLVGCMLPVIVTAVLLPPVIDMMRQVLPALGQHH